MASSLRITGVGAFNNLGTPLLVAIGRKSGDISRLLSLGEEATDPFQDEESMKSTGHERDFNDPAGVGDDLDYMHARFYNPSTGRFLTNDPARGKGDKPQTWNRYIYGLASPINYIDPDGREVKIPRDKRLRAAIAQWRSTPKGAADYNSLEQAEGPYEFRRVDMRLTPAERLRLRWSQEVVKTGGHFKPAYSVENGKVTWVSGGIINVDFATVDSASADSPPYDGPYGDAAIVAHEAGHGVHYENDRGAMVSLPYEDQERIADEHRDEVVKQLENQVPPEEDPHDK